MGNTQRTRVLAEIAIFLALATTLEVVFKVIPGQPQGGSVSLSMLPIFILTYRHGLRVGLFSGAVFGLLNLMVGGLVLWHWASLYLDYIFAFMVIGLAALVFERDKDNPVYFGIGILVGGLARFFMHFLSGVVLFGEFAPEGQNVWVYSFIYNMTYMAPTIALLLITGLLLYRRQILISENW